ncbi:hypothetical protein ACHAW5_003299 [Stephanodiscus triporus]|uniref:Uncharacterized protein n=1 Tax=Stephanodiscus triporus TaxID=2934178 RepID=A0ABD3NV74_9STRA
MERLSSLVDLLLSGSWEEHINPTQQLVTHHSCDSKANPQPRTSSTACWGPRGALFCHKVFGAV